MKKKWWLLAAGVLFSCLHWWKQVEPAAPEPGVVVVDDRTAEAAGDFEIELTRARRAPRAKRLASTLLFVTLFCAGAAFTAGAGNELVSTGETQAVAEAAAPSPEPAADAAPAPAVPVEAAAETPAPEPASTPDPAPAPAAPVEETAAPPVEPAPEAAVPAPESAPADDVTPTTAPTRADYTPSAPAEAPSPARVQATKKQRTTATRRSARHVVHTVAPRAPQVVMAETPSFVPAVPFDLPAWEHDNPGSTTGTAAVAIAQHFVGTPYVWGGASPTGGFDCSGLMLYVYGQLGVALPHYAASQFALFAKLQPAELQPGDLVFFEPKIDGPGHVAMYAGGDAIIEAPHTGALVRVGSLSRSAAALGFMGAVRPYAGTTHSWRALAQRHRTSHAFASDPGTAGSVLAA
jgi:cell wall-associated NlpC family hydrolase